MTLTAQSTVKSLKKTALQLRFNLGKWSAWERPAPGLGGRAPWRRSYRFYISHDEINKAVPRDPSRDRFCSARDTRSLSIYAALGELGYFRSPSSAKVKTSRATAGDPDVKTRESRR